MILPFVALISEKQKRIEKLLRTLSTQLNGLHGAELDYDGSCDLKI